MQTDFSQPIFLEEQLGVYVEDRALLAQAFTHRSVLNEVEDSSLVDNERLEFLGDAVLELIVSETLFAQFPNESEGELTRLRSLLVRRETLANVAEQYHLGHSLRLGKGEEESGGRRRPATLCAVFEAVMGALFVDQGIERTRTVVLTLLADELRKLSATANTKDPKSRLQEYVQSTFGVTPRYKTVSSSGPDHAKLFVQTVNIAKRPVGVGQGLSKQEAAQAAAAQALLRLQEPAPEYVADKTLEASYELAPMAEIWALAAPEA
jgi:ribonuclease-3